MIKLEANVVLYGKDQGGLAQPIKNGFRPSFSYQDELVACEVVARDYPGFIPLGQPFVATISVPYGDQLGWHFAKGDSFELNIASQVIGEGYVVASLG
jgi:hypothetical protein